MDDAIEIDLSLDNRLERDPAAVLDHLGTDLPVTSINAKDNGIFRASQSLEFGLFITLLSRNP
ncbi:MAG: hypothetical protein J4G05_08090 [Chlorobi bacterium]|nr:hypothetical protein [Chlorobiota bacterium]